MSQVVDSDRLHSGCPDGSCELFLNGSDRQTPNATEEERLGVGNERFQDLHGLLIQGDRSL